jgi:hypothetical protein
MAVAPAPAADLTGRASVIDGHTIENRGQRNRLRSSTAFRSRGNGCAVHPFDRGHKLIHLH